jgi:hypothetical protein
MTGLISSSVVVKDKSTEQGTCDASIRTFDLLGGKGTSNCPDSGVCTISFIVKTCSSRFGHEYSQALAVRAVYDDLFHAMEEVKP